eukprot:SAG31_NODE_8944_length_1359_cov_0.843651_2_plen_115_part_00
MSLLKKQMYTRADDEEKGLDHAMLLVLQAVAVLTGREWASRGEELGVHLVKDVRAMVQALQNFDLAAIPEGAANPILLVSRAQRWTRENSIIKLAPAPLPVLLSLFVTPGACFA